jgi:hypothetical protein
MKRWVPAIALAGVAGALLFYFLQPRAPSRAPNMPLEPRTAPAAVAGDNKKSTISSQGAGNSNATTLISAASETSPASRPSAVAARSNRAGTASSQPEFTNIPPAIVLESMRITFHQYASMFGGNPVGTNPEITAALNGKNPKQANFIQPEAGMRINDQGELVDPWGTPYFFHQLSGTVMEIHSAGPDRVMWTADDLVIK